MIHREWIQSLANKQNSPETAEWSNAWFALDALMHRVCHVATSIRALRHAPAAETEYQITNLISSLTRSHKLWRDREIVSKADGFEQMGHLLSTWSLLPSESASPTSVTSSSAPEGVSHARFLEYPLAKINNLFLASRLNHWRGIELYISLIRDGDLRKLKGPRFIAAVDLCRTYAGIGIERNYLGGEKSCGLYLAGLIFGGPTMYAVSFSPVIAITIRTNLSGWYNSCKKCNLHSQSPASSSKIYGKSGMQEAITGILWI